MSAALGCHAAKRHSPSVTIAAGRELDRAHPRSEDFFRRRIRRTEIHASIRRDDASPFIGQSSTEEYHALCRTTPAIPVSQSCQSCCEAAARRRETARAEYPIELTSDVADRRGLVRRRLVPRLR